MQHDVRLRAAVRVIFEACYDEWSPVRFEEAERLGYCPLPAGRGGSSGGPCGVERPEPTLPAIEA